MLHEFRMPDAGEGLTEAEVLNWRVAVGDAVVVNQILLEVETAKAAVELPSPYAGVVMEVLAAPGDVVPVGQPIIRIEDGVQAAPSPSAEGDGGAAAAARGSVGSRGAAGSRPNRRRRVVQPQRPPGRASAPPCSSATGSRRSRRPFAGRAGRRTAPTTSSPARPVSGAARFARAAWSSGVRWRPDWAATRCAPSHPCAGWHATSTWTCPRSCPPGPTGRSPTTTSRGRPPQRGAPCRLGEWCRPPPWPVLPTAAGARSCH